MTIIPLTGKVHLAVAKRVKIEINKNDALQEVDDELEGAMERLDGANARVDELLASFDAAPAGDEAVESPEASTSSGTEAGD